MPARPPRPTRGFTLIELMVALTIFGFALMMAVPAFTAWLHNVRLRSRGEALMQAVEVARTEAARRNMLVQLQLTTSLDNSCTVSTAGPDWVVHLLQDSTGASVSAAGACGADLVGRQDILDSSGAAPVLDDSHSPFLLLKSPVASNNTVTLSATQSGVAFNALGRSTASAMVRIDLADSSLACLDSSGEGSVRCLRLEIYPAGLVKLCDPLQTDSSSTLYCPT